MKRWSLILILFLMPVGFVLANCDLTRFRWECDVPMNLKPTRNATSLVYCGDTFVYVSKWEYDQLDRYQRASVNMILTANGEYFDGPCVPYRR